MLHASPSSHAGTRRYHICACTRVRRERQSGGGRGTRAVAAVPLTFCDLPPPSLPLAPCPCVSVMRTLSPVDAKRKGVKLAAHYSKFVDLVAEFSQTYPRLAQLSGVGAASLHTSASLSPCSCPASLRPFLPWSVLGGGG